MDQSACHSRIFYSEWGELRFNVKAAVPGLAVALLLTCLARPIAVLICLLPLLLSATRIDIAVMGIRGAVAIILAILPIMSQAAEVHQIFNVVFFSVIVNALIPGAW
jgi:potassium/hydrogen antiporter